nr:putative transposase, C-terminal part [uncultured archaeon]
MSEIGKELDALSEKGQKWSEAQLHKEINSIVGEWENYVDTRVKRKGNGPRIEWKYKSRQISASECSLGKYLLLSTDESLSPNEVIKTYFEKDFVEKVFRTLKTFEEIVPVRHRLVQRVRAYIFVCVLAFRLLADLQYRLIKILSPNGAQEQVDDLLRELERVERVQVRLGHQVKIWYLNVTRKNIETLEKMGFHDLLKETTEVDFKI